MTLDRGNGRNAVQPTIESLNLASILTSLLTSILTLILTSILTSILNL